MTNNEFWRILKEAGFSYDRDYEFVLNALSIFCDHEAELNKDYDALVNHYHEMSNAIYEALTIRGYYRRDQK